MTMRNFMMAALLTAMLGMPAGRVLAQEVVMESSPAMSYADACCALKSLCPGEHRLCIIHPFTCCPVEVCICVPCGCHEVCCKDGCLAKKIVFDYKGHGNDIVIKFKKNGTVSVH